MFVGDDVFNDSGERNAPASEKEKPTTKKNTRSVGIFPKIQTEIGKGVRVMCAIFVS